MILRSKRVFSVAKDENVSDYIAFAVELRRHKIHSLLLKKRGRSERAEREFMLDDALRSTTHNTLVMSLLHISIRSKHLQYHCIETGDGKTNDGLCMYYICDLVGEDGLALTTTQ